MYKIVQYRANKCQNIPICHKNKKLQIIDLQFLTLVGMPGFEPGAPCPPDKYSNRAELHPVLFSGAKLINYSGFPKKS